MKAIIEKKTVNKPYSSIEDLNGKMVEILKLYKCHEYR